MAGRAFRFVAFSHSRQFHRRSRSAPTGITSRESSASATGSGAAVPEPDLEQIETIARVYQLVDKLPWDQRYVIRLRFAEEKSIREIAQQLSRSEGAIKQLQFRALQNLRARMSEENV